MQFYVFHGAVQCPCLDADAASQEMNGKKNSPLKFQFSGNLAEMGCAMRDGEREKNEEQNEFVFTSFFFCHVRHSSHFIFQIQMQIAVMGVSGIRGLFYVLFSLLALFVWWQRQWDAGMSVPSTTRDTIHTHTHTNGMQKIIIMRTIGQKKCAKLTTENENFKKPHLWT